MKRVSIEQLRGVSERGAAVVDRDGLEVRFPPPRAKIPDPLPIPEKKESPAQPVVDSLDRVAQMLAKVLKANQATSDSVSAALSFMADAKPPARPKSFEVSLSRGKDGKIESMTVTPRF